MRSPAPRCKHAARHSSLFVVAPSWDVKLAAVADLRLPLGAVQLLALKLVIPQQLPTTAAGKAGNHGPVSQSACHDTIQATNGSGLRKMGDE